MLLQKENINIGCLNISPIGLGCVNLSGLYGKISEDSIDVIKYSLEAGVNLFDTADVYGSGQNEEMLAAALKRYGASRNKLILSTKCGVRWDKNNPSIHSVDNSPNYIKSCCEKSLKRLNTDYIDLYYLHRISGKGEMIEESMSALKELVTAGKIRSIGLSEASPEIIQKAHQIHPITAVQSEYSLMSREVENNGVLTLCKELDIGFIAYSPLCRGLLSSNFNIDYIGKNDFRKRLPRFQNKNINKNMSLVVQLENIAHKKKCTVSQLSLAWILAQKNKIIPIPGTKTPRFQLENIEAANIQLTEIEISQINEICSIGVVSGARYTPGVLKTYNMQ